MKRGFISGWAVAGLILFSSGCGFVHESAVSSAPAPSQAEDSASNDWTSHPTEYVLPPGKNVELVQAYCQMCHDLGPVVSQHLDAELWRRMVHAMVHNGAPIPPEDIAPIIDYLATTFGPVPE